MNMQFDNNTMIIDRDFDLLLGVVTFLGNQYFVLVESTQKIGVYQFGEVFQINRIFLLHLEGRFEDHNEMNILNEFFESYSGKLFYYIPYKLYKIVIEDILE
jgi:hypothetical protein